MMIRLFALLVAASLWCRCSHSIGGAGGETTNGVITGQLTNGGGSNGAAVQVRLFPADYDPVKATAAVREVFTDESGQYVFPQVPQGDYSLVAADTATGNKTLITGIRLDIDTFTAPTQELEAPGTIKTFVNQGGEMCAGYVFIPGTPCHATVNAGDAFTVLDSVPAGIIPRVSFSCRDSLTSEVIRYDIRVVSSDTAEIRNTSWRYARTLRLNTAESGAGVAADLVHFPVLVRLTGKKMDFHGAREDGADIRFAKPDGVELPFEIERWDAQRQLAEIWVTVDTIHGNDSEQSIVMYWGNPDAVSASGGAVVFDTVDGYAGVWHLGDDAGASRDATANGFDGSSPDTAQPLRVDGIAGYCRRFDGVDDFIVMPNTASGALNFSEADEYTVYAWVAPDAPDNNSHCIVAKGFSQYFLWCTYFTTDEPVWEFVEFGQSSNWQVTAPVEADSGWKLLVGVRRGDRQMLYCNGSIVDSMTSEWPQSYPRNTTDDVTIGRFLDSVPFMTNGGFGFYSGLIDEVRISGVARSPQWIRLCYMNQRSDDRLIGFE